MHSDRYLARYQVYNALQWLITSIAVLTFTCSVELRSKTTNLGKLHWLNALKHLNSLRQGDQIALKTISRTKARTKAAWLKGYSGRLRTERSWVRNPHQMLPPLVSQGDVVVPCKSKL